jgi:septal ring factor EnvC (AmiA/AmiB activator)
LKELDFEATQGRAAYARDRRLIERFVIAASLAGRSAAFDRSAAEVEAFVRAAGPAAVARTRDRAAALAENRQVQAELKLALALIGEAREAIVQERRGINTLLARHSAFRQARLAVALDAEHRARRLARQARTLRELAERVQPARSGSLAVPPLEKLRAPAPGTLIRTYGDRISGGRAATGLTYRTQSGAQVVAPASGAIRYAGLFRSYGQILILALDNDYLLVLAGMESVGARAGELVAAGQPVGRMAAKPAPELYVEVRRNGRPINPTGRLAS